MPNVILIFGNDRELLTKHVLEHLREHPLECGRVYVFHPDAKQTYENQRLPLDISFAAKSYADCFKSDTQWDFIVFDDVLCGPSELTNIEATPADRTIIITSGYGNDCFRPKRRHLVKRMILLPVENALSNFALLSQNYFDSEERRVEVRGQFERACRNSESTVVI